MNYFDIGHFQSAFSSLSGSGSENKLMKMKLFIFWTYG